MVHIGFCFVLMLSVLGRSVNTISRNTGALVVTSKDIGVEVKADKTKYMVMSQDRMLDNHNVNIDNKSFERVEQVR